MASSTVKLKGPTGTRDLDPINMLRQRYVTQVWRDTAIRSGFHEIEGPTFETSELYAVKSGDGILGELFQAFSGKSPNEVTQVREEGRAPFALRPEFTPTLARMYAAKAKQLPSPTRWFMVGPFFRAERPQRGRLREFLQWNCDILGDIPGDTSAPARDEVEISALMELALTTFGFETGTTTLRVNNRYAVSSALQQSGISEEGLTAALQLLDARLKMPPEVFAERAAAIGLDLAAFDRICQRAESFQDGSGDDIFLSTADVSGGNDQGGAETVGHFDWRTLRNTTAAMRTAAADPNWIGVDTTLVRGLAYYTGTVFEVQAEGERAVAGGGRYDKLIELFGGPPTPAVGMAMGDVVLMNLLDDQGLMPEGEDLLDAVSQPPASVRPDVVLATPIAELDDGVRALTFALRRSPDTACPDTACEAGQEKKPWQRSPGLHARWTDKTTRNIGKLSADARAQFARAFLVVESEREATLTSLGNDGAGERASITIDLTSVSGVRESAAVVRAQLNTLTP